MSELDELAAFFVHQVTTVPYLGESAYGPTYGPQTDVTCFVDDTRRSVRSAGGDEVISEATLFAPPEALGAFPTESQVTLWPGTTTERVATVITVKRHDSGALGLPDHLEVTLT